MGAVAQRQEFYIQYYVQQINNQCKRKQLYTSKILNIYLRIIIPLTFDVKRSLLHAEHVGGHARVVAFLFLAKAHDDQSGRRVAGLPLRCILLHNHDIRH